MYPKYTILSERVICMTFGEKPDNVVWQQVNAMNACLQEQPFPGILATIPAFVTLTIHFDPVLIAEHRPDVGIPAEAVIQYLKKASRTLDAGKTAGSGILEIPVRYGGDFGPDLPEISERLQLPEAAIIQRHANTIYNVYMIGFAPGFPYLGVLSSELELPRKKVISPNVPAGSVAIAGKMTCIYPNASPAGWYVIGRTDVRLFDPYAPSPCLLRVGMKVRFIPQHV